MKKIHLAGLLFFEFFATSVFCQKNCDTLYTTDGSQTLIQIVREYSHGLVYTKCEEVNGFRYYTIRDEIRSVRYRHPELNKLQKAEKRKNTSKTYTLNGALYTLWAGIDFNNSVGYGSYSMGFPIQFGLELSLPDRPIRLGLNFQPNYFSGAHRKDGMGTEVGLTVKKLSVGRLSGIINAAYWGLDLRVGHQPYKDTPQERIYYNWQKIMSLMGFQYGKDRFAIDLRLPIGIEFLTTKGVNSAHNWQDLAIEPTIAIGFRF